MGATLLVGAEQQDVEARFAVPRGRRAGGDRRTDRLHGRGLNTGRRGLAGGARLLRAAAALVLRIEDARGRARKHEVVARERGVGRRHPQQHGHQPGDRQRPGDPAHDSRPRCGPAAQPSGARHPAADAPGVEDGRGAIAEGQQVDEEQAGDEPGLDRESRELHGPEANDEPGNEGRKENRWYGEPGGPAEGAQIRVAQAGKEQGKKRSGERRPAAPLRLVLGSHRG